MTAEQNPLTTLGRVTFDATDEQLEDRVRALVSPTFTFRQQGERLDTEGFLAHLRELRAGLASGEQTVLDAFVDRRTEPVRAAARVHVLLRMTDGSVAEGEAQMIGVLDGDLIDTLHESGRLLADGDDPPEPTPVTAQRPAAPAAARPEEEGPVSEDITTRRSSR